MKKETLQLLESYSEDSTKWALMNELNPEEVIKIISGLSEERIEQIIENLN